MEITIMRNGKTERNNGNQLPRYWYGNEFEALYVDYRKPRIGHILDEDGNYPEGSF